MKTLIIRAGTLMLAAVVLTGCGGGVKGGLPGAKCVPSATNATIVLNWNANPDVDVNMAGGGYRAYHSTELNFVPGDPGVTMVDVPYAGGATAPTSATFNVSQTCEHYFKVQAYSTLNANGRFSEPLMVFIPNP